MQSTTKTIGGASVEPPTWADAGDDYDGVLRRFIESINRPAWMRARYYLSRTPAIAVGNPFGCCAWHAMSDAALLELVAADHLELIGRN